MTALFPRPSAWAVLLGLLAVVPAGCAVAPGGYGYAGDPGYGADYYEPFGTDFGGGWGPAYRVGPFRGGDPIAARGRAGFANHAFRGMPAGRAIPSIPSARRGGGGRIGGGGARGGGGRGR